jgi:hypothetical protein
LEVNESVLIALQKQGQANALSQVVLTIDLYMYKAQIAQQRWGTPGGNDVALQHYAYVAELAGRTAWPSELDERVAEFEMHLGRFREFLKAQDITRVSFQATRLAAAFVALRESLESWAAS